MKRTYTKEEVEKAVANSQCFSDVFRNLSLKINGGSYNWLKRMLIDYKIDIKHFLSPKELFKKNRWNKKQSLKGIENIISDQRLRAKKLTKFLIENGILYVCNVCGRSKWNKKPLTLDVDHIDENCLNNHINNLQFLCPNCHRQKTQK